MTLNQTTFRGLIIILSVIGITWSGFSKSGDAPMKHAVEFLVFEMAPEHRETFLKVDHQFWTDTLSKQPGFVSKEVWIDDHKPGQVTFVTYWESYKHWKSIPHAELSATDQRFKKAFGHPFKLVKELHKQHRWHRVKKTTNSPKSADQ